MDSLPEAEKKRLVEDACRAAYADEFIQALPQVCNLIFNVGSGFDLLSTRAMTHMLASVVHHLAVDKSNDLQLLEASFPIRRSYC